MARSAGRFPAGSTAYRAEVLTQCVVHGCAEIQSRRNIGKCSVYSDCEGRVNVKTCTHVLHETCTWIFNNLQGHVYFFSRVFPFSTIFHFFSLCHCGKSSVFCFTGVKIKQIFQYYAIDSIHRVLKKSKPLPDLTPTRPHHTRVHVILLE